MTQWLPLLGLSGLASVGLGIAVAVYQFTKRPPTRAPRTGGRGQQRARALGKDSSFRYIEPVVRFLAGWVSRLTLNKLREKIDRQLLQAGDWLGLTADEFIALSFLSACGGFGLGAVMVASIGLPPPMVVFFAAMGASLPHTRSTNQQQERFKSVNRGLPTAIDLAALCMGAGLDFPGALRQIVQNSGSPNDALTLEIQRILQELGLGHTRKQALQNFAQRVPSEAVQDFVGAVVQAEEKGNPLAEVLTVQAQTLRLRRTVMAEEKAAKAAVMMMFPLMLIFCAIILLLLGPFMLQTGASGFMGMGMGGVSF